MSNICAEICFCAQLKGMCFCAQLKGFGGMDGLHEVYSLVQTCVHTFNCSAPSWSLIPLKMPIYQLINEGGTPTLVNQVPSNWDSVWSCQIHQ